MKEQYTLEDAGKKEVAGRGLTLIVIGRAKLVHICCRRAREKKISFTKWRKVPEPIFFSDGENVSLRKSVNVTFLDK